MIRWLYTWLICLHPARFRERFGEQMTSVFDESLRQRGGIRLLADAAVSVLRQQLFRSDSSERRQAVARGLNLIWILSVIPVEIFVASELHPTTTTGNASVLYALPPVSMFFGVVSSAEPGIFRRSRWFHVDFGPSSAASDQAGAAPRHFSGVGRIYRNYPPSHPRNLGCACTHRFAVCEGSCGTVVGDRVRNRHRDSNLDVLCTSKANE